MMSGVSLVLFYLSSICSHRFPGFHRQAFTRFTPELTGSSLWHRHSIYDQVFHLLARYPFNGDARTFFTLRFTRRCKGSPTPIIDTPRNTIYFTVNYIFFEIALKFALYVCFISSSFIRV